MDAWKRYDSPITRFRQYLESPPISAWSEEQEQAFRTEIRAEILAAFSEAEKRLKPPVDFLFEDVFDRVQGKLVQQEKENRELVAK